MTMRDDFEPASPEFDRLMAGWFEAEARVREPIDLIDRTTARTRAIRPRPAWLLPERWIPMELTKRRVPVPRYTRTAVLVAVLVLIAAVALAIVGSQRRVSTPFPAPFGPAKNGSLFFVTNGGEIVGIDATTSQPTTLARGVTANGHPAISLLGTRVAFTRTEADGHHVDVADILGASSVRISTTALAAIPHDFAWSPDDQQLAWISGDDLWVARTDGTGSQRIDVGMTVSDIAWRPPTGAEVLLRASREGHAGLFLMRPDGSGLRPITEPDVSEFAYTEPDWSPDGSRLAYSSVPPAIVHVLTIDGLHDQTIAPVAGALGTLFPKWSPDGTRLAMVDWRAQGDGRVGIVPAIDLAAPIVDAGPGFVEGPDYVWSPDGTQILAIGWNSNQPWILDPMDGTGRKTSWLLPGIQSYEGGENTLLNVWQRLAR